MVDAAPRLRTFNDQRITLLDCGKRGGRAILEAIAPKLASEGADCTFIEKPSAHRMASRKLVEQLSENSDAVVYGVVD